MKLAIYSSPSIHSLENLCQTLQELECPYDLAPKSLDGSDMLLSYGGDGTFLSTARLAIPSALPLLGVNGGRLGFLANTAPEDFENLMRQILSNNYNIEERELLCVEREGENIGEALNEFSIQKNSPSMVHLTLRVDSLEVASYWADGVIVSTSTGSTAYSMSVGGAIVAPSCQCWIISPIAPHNLNLRPLVVSSNSKIEIIAQTRSVESSRATLDNRETLFESGTKFTLSRSPRTLRVVSNPDSSFYDTLRCKLHWGLDARG